MAKLQKGKRFTWEHRMLADEQANMELRRIFGSRIDSTTTPQLLQHLAGRKTELGRIAAACAERS